MLRLSLLVFSIIHSFLGFAQSYKEAQISLSGSFKKPLEIEAINKGGEIDFFCINKSWFPYQMEIIFSGVENLNGPRSQKNIVMPGRQRLLSLRIQDPNSPHTYEYTYNYALGNPRNVADLTHPYLIPCLPGKAVKINNISDQILLSDGDTIVAMRKGIVTAIPQSNEEADRLFNNTLEILHDDGTVAVYKMITSSSVFVKSGEKVYPGQSIAKMIGAGIISTNVYILSGQGSARNFDFRYALGDNETVNLRAFRSTVVVHPPSVIEKELSKKEIKKFRDGSLYKD